jgi:hypothetical protein
VLAKGFANDSFNSVPTHCIAYFSTDTHPQTGVRVQSRQKNQRKALSTQPGTVSIHMIKLTCSPDNTGFGELVPFHQIRLKAASDLWHVCA